ncbi:MAG: amino acid adenylation domain-containing protein [Myxococcota bacterium]
MMRTSKNVQEIFPLTPLQQGILYHSVEVDRSRAPYFFQLCFRIRGRLDVGGLERAWGRVVARHELLRADVQWQKTKEPVQLVYRTAEVHIRREQWSALGEAQIAENLRVWLEQDRAVGFEFSRLADTRLTLMQVAAEEHYLIWSYHHVTLDGWSVSNILGEVWLAYHAEVRGFEPTLAPVPPYRAYMDWVKSRAGASADEYWRELLADYEQPIDFPPRRPCVNQTPRAFKEQRLLLDVAESERARALARELTVTPNTLFQGVWALLVSLFSSREDVVFGVTVSGRPSEIAGADVMVGMFINTLPVRVRVEPELELSTWLRGLQEQNALLRQYEFSSLPHVAHLSGIPGDRALFDSIFVFENYPISSALGAADELNLDVAIYEPEPALASDEAEVSTTHAVPTRRRNNFPLSLIAIPGKQTEIAFCYHSDQVADYVVASMRDVYAAIIRRALNQPGVTLGELCRDARVLCFATSDAARAVPQAYPERSVHGWIREQAERNPATTALQFENESLTYAEFERCANALAERLRGHGVTPGRRVAICAKRSLDLGVAIYAVLKCGAAYVPLEPKFPRARLQAVLADSRAVLLLADHDTAEGLAATNVPVLVVDHSEFAQPSEAGVNSAVSPDAAAYVIYTSGSTGQPKGVVVTHRGLTNYVQGLLERLALPCGASMAMVSTVAADLGNTVLFGALCSGGTLHLMSEDRVFDGDAFGAYLRKWRVDVLKIVPSHLEGLMQASDPSAVLPRHTLILGGESTPWALVEKIRRHGVCRVINHYGPTETTVGVLTYECPSPPAFPESATLPLGRALPNSRVYVLDAALHAVPPAVVGEIYVGGAGVARQYLNRPDLTAERFVPDPYGSPGSRLYRTGDRARQLEGGVIEFLGRVDDQVKIRGHRVELGEIRAALLELPEVAEAHVVPRRSPSGATTLVAYLVGDSAQRSLSGWQSRLAERLPEHMLPSDYVWLDRFPLTTNGKLDRVALPEPERVPSVTSGEPRSEIEQKLVTIWNEVLKITSVGIYDDFFNCGGDSLLAFQVVALSRKAGLNLLPQDLFEQRTIAALALRLEAGEADEYDEAEAQLECVSRHQPIPLSYAQQRLLFLWRLEPASAAYNVPFAVRLNGALNQGALERAFHALSERHEGLRTTFSDEGGEGRQVIHPAPEQLHIPVVDLAPLPEVERDGRARALLEAASRETFDLERGPLLRIQLLRLKANAHILGVVLHHIVSDGWSGGILVRELVQLYAAFASSEGALGDHGPPLPELTFQYADYAVWQRRRLNAEELERQLSYWQERLGTEHSVLALPTDRPRPPEQSYRGGRHELELEAELVAALRALARREGVTLFTLLLAAFDVLLFRYSHQRDIRVGVPVNGRARPELEPIVGCFVNTLVLRMQLDGREPFSSLLERVQEAATRAQAHQDVPFEKLVEVLNPERSLSHSPLFQVLFNHQRPDYANLENCGDLRFEPVSFSTRTTQFDLALDTSEEDATLRAAFTYSSDLFEPTTISRFGQHYRQLLTAITRAPNTAVDDLQLLTPEEEQIIVRDWNQTQRVYETGRLLHEWIEARVDERPEAIAVVLEGSESRRLTYAELNTKANQLAHQLFLMGVGPEVLVGIYLERSLDMVVALLAVAKAGGGYIPLDPQYPAARLAYMLEHARPHVIVSARPLSQGLPETEAKLVCLDRDAATLERQSRENLLRRADLDNLAYCIYTSGSTGRPKGVMISNGALLNFLHSMREVPGLRSSDRVLALTSLSFDISGLEIYLPLLVGASIVLVSRSVATSASEIASSITRHGVNVVQATPATWQMLVEAPEFAELPKLRVLCGGEALSDALAWRLIAHHSGVFNLYGPTETTVWSSLCALDAAQPKPFLGRPIANTQLYVLDQNLRMVPLGSSGELFIGGSGLARGYLSQPALTAERFVPNPFGAVPGERLYRTGDVVRYTTHGQLEYLGRTDHQVKLRGFRIELGEIEARLVQHPSVTRAAVVVHSDADEARSLVAYVVIAAERSGAGEETELVSSLRMHLKATLPEYMQPSQFVLLERLPLTPNGKVDRKALPRPDRSLLAASYVAPRNELERGLCELWAELLKLPRVGVQDNFFALGGHSLLAVRMTHAARSIIGRKLPVSVVFQHQTVAEFAAALDAHSVPSSAMVTLQSDGDRPALYCIHPAGGHVLAYRELAQALAPRRPVYGLQAKSFYLNDGFDDSVESMASEYAREILELQDSEAIHLLGWSFGGVLALEVARVLVARGCRIGSLSLLDPRDLIVAASEPARSSASDRANSHPEALPADVARWLERSHLREKWLRLFERGADSRAWLIEQFAKRDLAGVSLDLPDEAELFSGANSLLLADAHPLRASPVPAHIWWSRESSLKYPNWETRRVELERRLGPVDSQLINSDHLNIVRDANLIAELGARLQAADIAFASEPNATR